MSLNSVVYSLDEVNQFDKRELIQELWSGYGKIVRLSNTQEQGERAILKEIQLATVTNHPRGWNTSTSHVRKLNSYEIEIQFYKKWAGRCNEACRVPIYFDSSLNENTLELLIEDLDASGYSKRRDALSFKESKVVIRWLANFHANFMN